MTTFIDSHAHLADPAFDDGPRRRHRSRPRRPVRAAIVCIGESIAAAGARGAIAAAHPGFVFATAGVHPHDAADFDPIGDVAAIRELVQRGAVAIGECGLDYHYDHSPRDFSAARSPRNSRSRASSIGPSSSTRARPKTDTRAMVAEAGAAGVRGVLHCYTGSHALAETALGVGWYVSFSGIVTFKKWDDDALIRLVPDDRVLVESDSPYLAPVPNRGKRNEPAWVSFTVARVARGARHRRRDAAAR